jgi:YidC/Oxa1 family membrane protein insertase
LRDVVLALANIEIADTIQYQKFIWRKKEMSFDNNGQPDNKKLLLAVIAFIALMFGYNYFFETPNPIATQDTSDSDVSEKNEDDIENEVDKKNDEEIPVEEILAKSTRVTVENDHINGSIDLQGGVLDYLTLKDYKESLSRDSKNVTLFLPKNTSSSCFYTISYKVNNEIISDKTIWQPCDNVANKKEIAIRTQTQNGLIIERIVILDDAYLITIKDKIKNISKDKFKIAVSADLIKNNPKLGNYAVVHEGMVGYSAGVIEEIKYKDIEGKSNLQDSSWFGITDIYWLSAIINKSKNMRLRYSKISENSYKITNYSKKDIVIPSEQEIELQYKLFVGPKDIGILKHYCNTIGLPKFEMARDFGWFFLITKPLIQLLDLLAGIFSNMGLVILVLTLLFKLLTYPLTKKSFVSAAKMKEMQPQISALQQRYAHDKTRMNQELIAFYKKEQISPLSGCLPMLLQAPIFFCLYKVFFISIQMRQAPLFGWINDLSVADQAYIVNLFGLIDWTPPGFLRIGVWPLIMGATMLLQQKMSSTKAKTAVTKTSEQKIQENMMLIMPIRFTYICASFPVGVVIYWTISNVISMIQQQYTNKHITLQKKK